MRYGILTFLRISILLLAPYNLYSCSCDTLNFELATKIADEIFLGEIIKAEKVKITSESSSIPTEEDHERWLWKYTFSVNKKWKGSTDKIIEVFQEGTSCDYYYDLYELNYLVYVSKYSKEKDHYISEEIEEVVNNKLTTYLCSRTIYDHPWENDSTWFNNDVIKLNQLYKEIRVNDEYSVGKKYWISFILIGICLVILVFKFINK